MYVANFLQVNCSHEWYYIALYFFLPASSGLLYSSLALYGPSKHFDGYCACIMLAISKGYSCVREIQLTKEAAALKYVVMEWVITVILVFSLVKWSKFSRVFFISLNCFMITMKPLFKSFLNLDFFRCYPTNSITMRITHASSSNSILVMFISYLHHRLIMRVEMIRPLNEKHIQSKL